MNQNEREMGLDATDMDGSVKLTTERLNVPRGTLGGDPSYADAIDKKAIVPMLI